MNLNNVNKIIAVGSVDGILTLAAVMRFIGREIDIEFCQAFTVDKIDVDSWETNRQVCFVDLAVNNRDPKITENFVFE
jgi:hypothetical protein